MLRQFLVFLAICAFTTAFLQDKIAEDTAKRIAPKFKRKLTNVLMKPVGSSVRLKCAADGNPTPNITWSKNNGPIIRRYFQPRYGKWSVYFEELGKPDDGNYTCLVCNGLGCISNTFVLTVVERYPSKPIIKDGYPGNITALVNDTIKFSCPAITDLEPYLYWVKAYDNFTIADIGLYEPTIPGVEVKSDNPADEFDTLTVANVTLSDRGWYACVAINSLGTTTAMGYLAVLEKTK